MRGDGQDAATEPRWQYAIDDMRQQIAELMEPRSFTKTPWEWLRQYPRYFRAICCRLENLPGGVPRDWQKFQEFQPRWQLYLEHARHQQAQGIVDPELLHAAMDARGIPRLAVRPKARHRDPRLAQAAGATMGGGANVKRRLGFFGNEA